MKKSNLYAERIYSEHPLALWPLDDEITFFQILSNSQQQLDSANWTKTNATAIEPAVFSAYPVATGQNSKFTLLSSASGGAVGTFVSTFTYNSLTDFNSSRSTACLSVNAYTESEYMYRYEVGVIIDSIEYSTQHVAGLGWQLISHTFSIPATSKNISFFVKAYTYVDNVDVQFNGLSLGQWSEQFNSFSLGYNDFAMLPSITNVINNGAGYTLSTADSYGIDEEANGYYIISDGRAYVRPSGLPLAYGSYQSLSISKAPDSNPSIILPGKGLLNDSGKYNAYTLEAWIRINNSSLDPIRIIGPTKSTDGIYIEEGFISVYIGPYTKSYFVGKFNRPMLLNFQYTESKVILLLNGEQVISMDIDISNISFPPSELYGTSMDWIGVYGSDALKPFEIDSISIFPYLLPPEVAKKHFVYGQGVQEFAPSSPEFLKKTVEIDFPYAEYAYNVIYPDTAPWRSGFSINLNTTSSYLSTKDFGLPTVFLKSNGVPVDEATWYGENRSLNMDIGDFYPYVSMNPTGTYDESTIYFKNINVIGEKIESVFGYFKLPQSASASQIIMSFNNTSTAEKIQVSVESNSTLEYNYISPSGVPTTLFSEAVTPNEYFTAGLNISRVSASSYFTIGSFFVNQDKISLNIGGYGQSMFLGRIFGIHFNNPYFFDKDLSQHFNGAYIEQPLGSIDLMRYIGNYSLLPVNRNTTMAFDIGSAGYWEDVVPLSMFGKIISASGASVYDLDMIQFNIDSPYQLGFGSADNFTFTYSMIPDNVPAATYNELEALGYTSYNNMQNQLNAAYQDVRYDTSVKLFVTLQNYSLVGNKAYSDFVNTASANYSKVIEFDTANISNTKYEIFDNSIILVPDDVVFSEYYLGVHIEMRVRGTLEKNMLIKRLELASFVANDGVPTKVGTKYSYPIYPFAVIP